MIKINLYGYKLEIKGHANYAENGTDIVCAAVSALVYTLAQNLENNKEWLKTDPTIILNSGNALIDCFPKSEYKEKIELMYDVMMCGFELLKNNFSKNIQMGWRTAD